ncbi:hypothetical protein BMF35_a2053 [Aurantiacibacter gangjinensis]|nr:hypothetical protein BMF35_a2053 [Aurantiacibacter gangjinensis]
MHDATPHEVRQRGVIDMLQLAGTAFAEVAARWLLIVRSALECAVREQHIARRSAFHVLAVSRNAIALCGEADDFSGFAHRKRA